MSEIPEFAEGVKKQADKLSKPLLYTLFAIIPIAIALVVFLVDLLLDIPEKVEKGLHRFVVFSNEWLEKPVAAGSAPELKLYSQAYCLTLFVELAALIFLALVVYYIRSRILSSSYAAEKAIKDELILERRHLESHLNTLRTTNSELSRRLGQPHIDFFTTFKTNATSILQSNVVRKKYLVHQHDTIYKVDGTGAFATVTRCVEASTSPIVFLYGGAEGFPAPLQEFTDINLIVECDTPGKTLHWLPLSNEPNRKKFIIIVSPELMPGEKLEYRYMWQWKGAMEPLVNKGIDSFTQSVRSDSEIPSVIFDILLHERFGPVSIKCTGFGEGELIDKGPPVVHEYRTYRMVMKPLPPANDDVIVLDMKPL